MLKTITQATDYAISVADLKLQIRYQTAESDAEWADLIAEASDALANETDRSLVDTTYEKSLDGFRRRIWLPKPPLFSVEWVKYYDASNELQTLDDEDYFVCTPTMTQGFVELAGCWPQTYCRPDAVTIRYRAKWASVPLVVKRCLKKYAAYHNADREAQQKDFTALSRMIDLIRHEGYPC